MSADVVFVDTARSGASEDAMRVLAGWSLEATLDPLHTAPGTGTSELTKPATTAAEPGEHLEERP